MKIGLLGGTFNPPHLAHLRIAEEAREVCGLERVLFIPAADPPHKRVAGETPFEERCRMVALAIDGNAAFELSRIEGERPGKSYSIDTLTELRARHPADDLHFIVGSDSFLEIETWHRYRDILRGCSLIVVERPGGVIERPDEALPVAMRPEFVYTAASRRLEHVSTGVAVQFVTGCPLEISSSAIRGLACAGRSLRYLVPPLLEKYISEQRIYDQCRKP